MKTIRTLRNSLRLSVGSTSLVVLVCGCDDDGPKVQALPQTVSFAAVEQPARNQSTVHVSATASSGLAVTYSSVTPEVCLVDAAAGRVTARAAGTCTIAANQSGNNQFAPAAQVTIDIGFVFSGTLALSVNPTLGQFDQTLVATVGDNGQSVTYGTLTAGICSVDSETGYLLALQPGSCTVTAATASDMAQATVDIVDHALPSLPAAPEHVTARLGKSPTTVRVDVGGVESGGSPIVAFRVDSVPSGISQTAVALPIHVDCSGSCAGYAFGVTASNTVGTGPASVPVDVVTSYGVLARFYEPDTQPNDTIFVGSFSFDVTTGEVLRLRGKLSESMTGGDQGYPNDSMSWLVLEHQLSNLSETIDAQRSVVATTFLLENTNTLTSDATFGGTDGWAPGSGKGLHYGYPGANPGNAYVRIVINAADPLLPLTQAQLDRLAYADCAAGGMMGATCMTGTSAAGYGTDGTMSGCPAEQITSRR